MLFYVAIQPASFLQYGNRSGGKGLKISFGTLNEGF